MIQLKGKPLSIQSQLISGQLPSEALKTVQQFIALFYLVLVNLRYWLNSVRLIK